MPSPRLPGAVLLSVAGCLTLTATEISSPDGSLVVDFQLREGGVPSYSVRRAGAVVLEPSSLGVVFKDADFSRSLRLLSESRLETVRDRYELTQTKRQTHDYRAKRRVFSLVSAQEGRMDIVFQVSNDGVAFRYEFPANGDTTTVHLMQEEVSSFNFPSDAKGWLQPMSVAKSGWAKTNPSYEEYHEQEIPVGTPSSLGAGWVYPALFRTGDTWVALTEAALGRGYCATRLRHESPGGEYRIGFPDVRETINGATVTPEFRLPYQTPWRVLAIGSLKTVVESTLGTDVAAPALKGVKPLGAPGYASWSWPKLGDSKTDYPTSKRFIEFAAEMGWDYCLIDALWDKQIGEEKVRELVAYAASKKVGVLLWYNTNGNWNDAYQTPKNRMLTKESRKAEFEKLKSWGVKGLKIDFFGGDGRPFVDLYLDILEESAPYGFLINFHGATLSRGWQRTYPHLMTVEAVKGYEFITFEQGPADRAPTHMAMQPFTRNLFDPMDFTPLCLAPLKKIQRRTTVGAELAMAVLFTSGIQHYIEIPEGLATMPAYIRQTLKVLPTRWTDVRFIAGYPGKLAVLARQGQDGSWWVAGINGEATEKTVELPLGDLLRSANQQLTLLTDAAGGGFEQRGLTTDGTTLRVAVQPNGGFLFKLP